MSKRKCPVCKKEIGRFYNYCGEFCADKHRKTHPYLLKIFGLNRKYCDPVELILQANFQILVDFVEKEKPEEVVNWDSDPEHAKARDTFKGLYYWWTKGRPAAKKLHSDLLHNAFKRTKKTFPLIVSCKASLEKADTLERVLDAMDQKQLHRLIDIRGFLWT